MSLHLVGLLNLLRVLGSCCTIRVGRWVRNVLFGAALMLLWFYLVNICAVLDSSRRDKLKVWSLQTSCVDQHWMDVDWSEPFT